MVRPVNIGKRGLLQALTPAFLLAALFCAAAAWEEIPFGPLSTSPATLEVTKARSTRFIFRSGDQSGHCPASLCFRRGLEARHGETFTVERDRRGLVFSISDQSGEIVSRAGVRKEFLASLGWGLAWLSLFGLGLIRLMSRRRFSDE